MVHRKKKIRSLSYFHCHTAGKWMEFLWRDFPIIIDKQSVNSTWLLLMIDNEISADSQHYSKGGMTLQRCFFRKKWLINERRLTDMNRRLTVVSPTSILFTYVFCCCVSSLNASSDQLLKDLVHIHAYHHFLYQGWDKKVDTCAVLVSLLKQNA